MERFNKIVEYLTMQQEVIGSAHDEMRNSIINAATKAFSRFGFRRTSMDDIAHSLRMGKSSIYYYYFKGKEEIFKAVVAREANQQRENVRKMLESSDDAVSKMRSYVKLRMEFIRHLSSFVEQRLNDDLKSLQLTEKFRKKYDDEEISIITQILEEGSRSGIFKVKDFYMSALAIVTAMKGLELPLVSTTSDENAMNPAIDDLLDILFFGIVKR